MSLLGVSIITCAVLYGLLAAILVVVFAIAEVPIWISFAIVVAVILLQFLLAPWITDLMQRWFYKTDFNARIPDYLERFIRQTCEQNGVKYPKIGIINDGAPNAFTYGRTKSDARIVLTRGIFELLDEEEVKAVVAHEIGHIVHYDMALMTMVQVVPMVFYMVYTALMPTNNNSSSGKDSGAQAIVAMVAFVLYIVCQYIILWLSRVREYYADEFSAQVTNNPNALASALVNIGFGLSTREKGKDTKGSASGQSTLGIFDSKNSKSMVVSCYNDGVIDKGRIKNAMKWELWNTWAFWYELGSTHPLTSKRIFRLDKLAKEQGQAPFVNFDLQKPESYVDDFMRELGICIMPWVGAAIAGVVAVLVMPDIMSENQAPWLVVWGAIVVGVGLVLSCLKYLYTHPRSAYYEANTAGLLSEVKVSMVRSIPAELKGVIIGRGNPGCIFNEDFVIRDETGILFLDYNQPLWIINKIFALFKSPKYFNKQVVVRGWYRRNMVPFMELYSIEVDGQVKKCFTYGFGWAWRLVLLALCVVAAVAVLVL